MNEEQSNRAKRRWEIKDSIRIKVEYDFVANLLNIQSKSVKQIMKREEHETLQQLVWDRIDKQLQRNRI